MVSMPDNQGFEGVLWAVDATGMVLRASGAAPVELVTPDGERQPADGEVFIPASQVLFVQVLDGGAG